MAYLQSTTRRVKTVLSAACLIAAGMGALEAAVLKDKIEVAGDTVRLGDLFHDPENGADVIIMTSPAPGKLRQISAYELESLAAKNGISWERPGLLKNIKVKRAGIRLSKSALEEMIKVAARSAGIYNNLSVRLFGSQKALYMPTNVSANDLIIEEFILGNNKDRFTAIFNLPTTGSDYERVTLTGSLEQIQQIPVLAENVMPGDIITKDDIIWASYPVRRLGRTTIQSSDQLIGMILRRPMRSGNMVRTTDVKRPELVKKGSAVRILLYQGPLKLSSVGKALESGGKGDLIRIMNMASKKTIEARVTAEGRVEIVSASFVALNTLN